MGHKLAGGRVAPRSRRVLTRAECHWDTYRAALDAAIEELRPVAWEEETWLLAPQARDPRIRRVAEERGRRARIDADGEPEMTVRLSRNARAILVERGLLPARDDDDAAS